MTGVGGSSAVRMSVTASSSSYATTMRFGSILGQGPAGRDHGRDRLALPADPIDRDRVLRRRFQALQMREHADPGRDDGGKFLSGDDSDDAGHLPSPPSHRCQTILACACGERRKTTCAIRGSSMSLT